MLASRKKIGRASHDESAMVRIPVPEAFARLVVGGVAAPSSHNGEHDDALQLGGEQWGGGA